MAQVLPAIASEGKDNLCIVCDGKHETYKERNSGVSHAENPFKTTINVKTMRNISTTKLNINNILKCVIESD